MRRLLFLQHMLSKQSPTEPTRIITVFNGSPLFTGDTGSGESNIQLQLIQILQRQLDRINILLGTP